MSAQLLNRRGCTAPDHESKLTDGAISRVKVTGRNNAISITAYMHAELVRQSVGS
jgi:hypothetical protein